MSGEVHNWIKFRTLIVRIEEKIGKYKKNISIKEKKIFYIFLLK